MPSTSPLIARVRSISEKAVTQSPGLRRLSSVSRKFATASHCSVLISVKRLCAGATISPVVMPSPTTMPSCGARTVVSSSCRCAMASAGRASPDRGFGRGFGIHQLLGGGAALPGLQHGSRSVTHGHVGLVDLLLRDVTFVAERAQPRRGALGERVVFFGGLDVVGRDGGVRALGEQHAPARLELRAGDLEVGARLRDQELIGARDRL